MYTTLETYHPTILLRHDVTEVDPKVDLRALGVRLVTIDVENVLTDFGNPTVTPEGADFVGRTLQEGIAIALATNNKNQAYKDANGELVDDNFVDYVCRQLFQKHGAKIMPYYPAKDGRIDLVKKPSPGLFKAAAREFGINPRNAAHIDDQGRALLGARRAGFGTLIWTRPIGAHQHRGVRAFRAIENPIRGGIYIAHSLTDHI